jgi:alkanesulfonate monooxygenase SsuD/methylene tetrahydromethanopterin reductase-like flavin-dependent oxidoreductase (luciferase family)
VKLGIGLPNTLAHDIDRTLFLSWARMADEAGFHTLGTIDKPNYDSWDPLTTLAAAAPVTERARLATTILQLPNRNEVLVAKQAAVIDQVSGGRLDLGVAVGGREDDYEIFEAHFRGKGRKFARQIERIREIWTNARSSDHDHGVLGPAPVQDPGPPIWVGAASEPAVKRALDLGDAFIFGTAGAARMAQMTPMLREEAAKRGKPNYTVAGLAYVGVGDDPAKALEEATHHVLRYYGRLWGEPADIIHHGPGPAIAEDVAKYVESGIDLLILFPEIPDLSQVERLAEDVLPAYL